MKNEIANAISVFAQIDVAIEIPFKDSSVISNISTVLRDAVQDRKIIKENKYTVRDVGKAVLRKST